MPVTAARTLPAAGSVRRADRHGGGVTVASILDHSLGNRDDEREREERREEQAGNSHLLCKLVATTT